MRLTSTVNVVDHFDAITHDVDLLARRACQAAAEAAAEAAKAAGAANNATEVEVVDAHGDIDGYVSGINGRWYYRFLSYGTLGRAIKPKRPGHVRSHAPGTGIAPNKMYQLARRAGRRRLLETLKKVP